MNIKRKLTTAWLSFCVSAPLLAANTPIQRIDVTNMLGAGGATPTAVSVSFSTGVATPCFSTTLPYLGTTTVWVGVGQTCSLPIIGVNVVPTGTGAVYAPAANPIPVSGTQYLSQITITQNTPPVFNPTSGALTSLGTVDVSVVSNLRK